MLKPGKKASLEMSIRTIVVVVLAMTLLMLGLGFIRSQFQDITSLNVEIQEQVKDQITSQLRTSGDKLSFPSTVQLQRGERKTLNIGVQNTGSEVIYFGLDVTWDAQNSDHAKDSAGAIDPSKTFEGTYNPRYLSNPCSFSLAPSEANAYLLNMKAPNTAGTDMVVLKVRLGTVKADGTCDPSSTNPMNYATKTSFITVG